MGGEEIEAGHSIVLSIKSGHQGGENTGLSWKGKWVQGTFVFLRRVL